MVWRDVKDVKRHLVCNTLINNVILPISMAVRSKSRVYSHSLAGIAGSNPADFCGRAV